MQRRSARLLTTVGAIWGLAGGCIDLPSPPPRPAANAGVADGGTVLDLDCLVIPLRNTLSPALEARGEATFDPDGATFEDEGFLQSTADHAFPLRLTMWVSMAGAGNAFIATRAAASDDVSPGEAGVRLVLNSATGAAGDDVRIQLRDEADVVATPRDGWTDEDRFRVVLQDDGQRIDASVFASNGARLASAVATSTARPGRRILFGGSAASTLSDVELCRAGTCQSADFSNGVPNWLEATDEGVQDRGDGVASVGRSTLRSRDEVSHPIRAEIDLTWTGSGIAFIGTRSTGLRAPPFDEPASSAIARVHNNVNGINAMYLGDFFSGGSQTLVGHTDVIPTFNHPYRIIFEDDGEEVTATWVDLETQGQLIATIIPGGSPPADFFVLSGDPTVTFQAATLCTP